jgi:hypothetical protein
VANQGLINHDSIDDESIDAVRRDGDGPKLTKVGVSSHSITVIGRSAACECGDRRGRDDDLSKTTILAVCDQGE